MVTNYVAKHLMPGERLVAVSRIHPMELLAPGIIATVGLLLSAVGIVAGEYRRAFEVVGIPMVLVAGLPLIALLVERLTTEYSCTDRRILIKSGFLTTQLREMPLGKVEASVMRQGPFGKIFGFGTLVFKGSGGTRRTCKSIESPFDFYRRVHGAGCRCPKALTREQSIPTVAFNITQPVQRTCTL